MILKNQNKDNSELLPKQCRNKYSVVSGERSYHDTGISSKQLELSNGLISINLSQSKQNSFEPVIRRLFEGLLSHLEIIKDTPLVRL